MGVPAFYRWLVNKYPKVVDRAIEEKGDVVDTSSPNPNGLEFDNFYLDMNGIIHPCFHPDDLENAPKTFEDVFINVFGYIDRLFGIVRPRKVLYLAIDGVAPRAKMNQQRARRFRTAKDNEIAEVEEERLRREFEKEGKQVLPKEVFETSDSNVITPGTEFMFRLSTALRKYIRQKLNNDPGWKNIMVILSDANVPGEGEHKIMSYIRQNRLRSDYSPNTRHCLYGLDADLIMLALASHEPHFSILREDVQFKDPQLDYQLALATEPTLKSTGLLRPLNEGQKGSSKRPYDFVHIWILREYLEIDLTILDPPENFRLDFERVVDDFVFMCFFAGNDFLPHIPSLEIHEGAIDLLLHVYKKEFKNLGGHLIDMTRVQEDKWSFLKLSRVERFILSLGSCEEQIFKKRADLRQRKMRRILNDQLCSQDEGEGGGDNVTEECRLFQSCSSTCRSLEYHEDDILRNTMELKSKLKERLRRNSDLFKNGVIGVDKVRLHENGWKRRYYEEKFSASSQTDMENARRQLVQKYAEGLVWVLLYYFNGVPSWSWYYPYHYGPFASDFKGLSKVSKVKFQRGFPFKPFDQLLAVFPPRSAHALPVVYQHLMIENESRIIDFYPIDFEVDTDGKRHLWQGICKLPFIDDDRLLKETRSLEKELDRDEESRNGKMIDQIFVRKDQNYDSLAKNLENDLTARVGGLQISSSDSTNTKDTSEMTQEDNVICVNYELPTCGPHYPRLLEDVRLPDKIVSAVDIIEKELWHESNGRNNGRSYRSENQRTSAHMPRRVEKFTSCSMNDGSAGAGFSVGRGRHGKSIISEGKMDSGNRNSGWDARRNLVPGSPIGFGANNANFNQGANWTNGRYVPPNGTHGRTNAFYNDKWRAEVCNWEDSISRRTVVHGDSSSSNDNVLWQSNQGVYDRNLGRGHDVYYNHRSAQLQYHSPSASHTNISRHGSYDRNLGRGHAIYYNHRTAQSQYHSPSASHTNIARHGSHIEQEHARQRANFRDK